ncbi:hypothetical protein HOLleu_33639 [Holothuria leucospilota]|uniref:Uncharacterized protein n=1 Tax=Holothuria leucospilota TaxID=206669 RepID=A0A9Q0YSS0_HOLLE|nr:hypothetical protein HOLleu_33639 [Holothuria leucospilota]
MQLIHSRKSLNSACDKSFCHIMLSNFITVHGKQSLYYHCVVLCCLLSQLGLYKWAFLKLSSV